MNWTQILVGTTIQLLTYETDMRILRHIEQQHGHNNESFSILNRGIG
jgi:hypothetical protein